MDFSQWMAASETAFRERRHYQRLGIDFLAALGYSVPGLWLSCDTGFAPWQWQFWLMFAPLFAAGELAWRACMGRYLPWPG